MTGHSLQTLSNFIKLNGPALASAKACLVEKVAVMWRADLSTVQSQNPAKLSKSAWHIAMRRITSGPESASPRYDVDSNARGQIQLRVHRPHPLGDSGTGHRRRTWHTALHLATGHLNSTIHCVLPATICHSLTTLIWNTAVCRALHVQHQFSFVVLKPNSSFCLNVGRY